MTGILSTAGLGFPFETDSPFLFAVYHKDLYPPGNAEMGVDASLLRGHRIGADFGHPSGFNMYHGSEGLPGFPKHPHRALRRSRSPATASSTTPTASATVGASATATCSG